MFVSESLYVGTGPDPDEEQAHFNRRVVNVATAQQAADVINANGVAVVPTTDVAKQALVVLGYGPAWAAFAVHETGISADDPVLNL